MFKIVVFFITITIFYLQEGSCQKLQEYFHWNALDYSYSCPEERLTSILENRFIPENNLPVGIEIWKEKLFITVPRWREGIPSTLNYILLNESTHDSSPPLRPYPNWETNEAGNCGNGLTTVYRIKADKCDRLWVLDTGTFGIEDTTRRLCPYTLNIFDLYNNVVIRKYQLPEEQILQSTFIANIVVDVNKNCDDTFAYMSDELGYGLIVYSWEQNKSWRFSHGFFMPDPLAGDFNIDGLNFQWEKEGVFGMVLSPLQTNDGHKILYFSPLASYREFAVSTRVLKDQTRVNNSYHEFVALSDRGVNTHITAKTMDERGVEFFSLIDNNAIGCWYSGLPYSANYFGIVDKNDQGLIFPSDIKIDEGKNLWVISDQMSNFLLRELDYSKINFRIFFAPVDVLIKDTICEVY